MGIYLHSTNLITSYLSNKLTSYIFTQHDSPRNHDYKKCCEKQQYCEKEPM